MTTIQIHIDDNTKIAADSIFMNYGMNIESALKVFLLTAIKQKSIPFAIGNNGHYNTDELEKIRQRRLATKGSLKGQIWMADDFDEPLEEMKEYME